MLEKNRKIKCLVFTDINAFDSDYRSKFVEKLERELREYKMLVVLFRRDYQAGKEPLINH